MPCNSLAPCALPRGARPREAAAEDEEEGPGVGAGAPGGMGGVIGHRAVSAGMRGV